MRRQKLAEARIARLLTEKVRVELPSAAVDLIESGVLDSVRIVTLLLALEQEFGVPVAMEELEVDDFRSIARIARFVAAHARAGG